MESIKGVRKYSLIFEIYSVSKFKIFLFNLGMISMAELSYTQAIKQNVIVRKIHLTFLVDFGTYLSRQECCADVVECLIAVRSQRSPREFQMKL